MAGAKDSGTKTQLKQEQEASVNKKDNFLGTREDDKGEYMIHGDLEFRTADQLPEDKQRRFKHYKIKPIEELTIDDLEKFNRDQLRAYCYIYGLPRTKKIQMESDMIRHVAAWNHGDPAYDIEDRKFVNYPNGLRPLSDPAEVIEQRAEVNRLKAMQTSIESSTPVDTAPGHRPARRHSEPARYSVTTGRPIRKRKPSTKRIPSAGARTPRRSLVKRPVVSGPHPAFKTKYDSLKEVIAEDAFDLYRESSSKKNANAVGVATTPEAKHQIHEEQAGAKFKAAYDGAGPLMVKIVENAAAYLEGKESVKEVEDKKMSLERYQFNVNLLKELFEEGAKVCREFMSKDTAMEIDKENEMPKEYNDLKERISKALVEKAKSRTDEERRKEVEEVENAFDKTVENSTEVERFNSRPYRKVERAQTVDDVAKARVDYEKEHSIVLEKAPPPVVKVDLSPPNVFGPMENGHIVNL